MKQREIKMYIKKSRKVFTNVYKRVIIKSRKELITCDQ